jgi:prolyl oligopeptidase
LFGLLEVAACGAPQQPTATPPSDPPLATAAPVTNIAPSPSATRSVARAEPLVEETFGIKVSDPYRWMEQPENAELTQWMDSEGTRARQALDAIPGRKKLLARVLETGLDDAIVARVVEVGDSLFYLRAGRGESLRKLVMRGKDGAEKVLVDPATLAEPDGTHASIDHFQPSQDGALVAYGLAHGGGEITTEHVLDVATGRELPDRIEHIWGEFAVSWLPDAKGFFYTQMAPEGFTDPKVDKLQGMRVFLHRLGEPTGKDVPVLGYGVSSVFPLEPKEFPWIWTPNGSPWVLAFAGGAHHEIRLAIARVADLHGAATKWTKVCDDSDEIEDVTVHKDDLILKSSKGASNKQLLRLSAKTPRLDTATVLMPASDQVIEQMTGAADGLYVALQRDGRSSLRRVDYGSGHSEEIALPFDGWIDRIVTDIRRPGARVAMEGWTHDDAFYTIDAKSKAFAKLDLKPPSTVDFSQIAVDEVNVPTDGVEVPLSILHRKDLPLDGSHPTIVYGYGAYGFSMTPMFLSFLKAWLERGGIWAVAHVRGGGEKGDAWRKAGAREAKPHSWRDFNACAEWLIEKGYTSKAKLAAYSASAGGILVGRAITERPDLYVAAGIYAGEVNALRYLEGTNGANQSAELGTPDTEAGFRALLEMDAYQHVKEGVAYPALLLATGMNDSRVSPWLSAKLAARMEASTSSGRPVLLRVEKDEGHGVGSKREQRLAVLADMWSFFLQQMGDPEFSAR